MLGKAIDVDVAIDLCEKAFEEKKKVNLPNGSCFPSASSDERMRQFQQMVRKISEAGKDFVVTQDDNRSLTLRYFEQKRG